MSLYGKLTSALVSVAIVGAGGAYLMSQSSEVMAEVTSLAEELSCYTLREYQGKIGLFKGDSDEPAALYSIPVDGINPADLQLLREGISLRGLDEVVGLLEDLGIE